MSAFRHKIADNQWLGDVAVQCCGSFEAVMQLAIENDISITETLISGNELGYSEIKNKQIREWYTKNNIVPATVLTAVYDSGGEVVELPGGIGYMAVSINFIVS